MLHDIDDTQRVSEALDKAQDLEKKNNEMSDKMNALITKERSTNHELQRVCNKLSQVSYPYLKL